MDIVKTFIQLIFPSLLGIITGIILYHFTLMPIIIDQRAKDLDLMRYSHSDGGFVAITEAQWMLHYLKYGTMESKK